MFVKRMCPFEIILEVTITVFEFLTKVVIPDPHVGLGAHRGVYGHIFHTGLCEVKKWVS